MMAPSFIFLYQPWTGGHEWHADLMRFDPKKRVYVFAYQLTDGDLQELRNRVRYQWPGTQVLYVNPVPPPEDDESRALRKEIEAIDGEIERAVAAAGGRRHGPVVSELRDRRAELYAKLVGRRRHET